MEIIPILKLEPLLLVSIQSELHDRAAEELQDTILKNVRDTEAKGVLIDITALEIVDSFIGRILSDTALMAKTLDAHVVLVGTRPEVTLTLLEMGLTLPGIDTANNVECGLEELGYRLVPIENHAKKNISETSYDYR